MRPFSIDCSKLEAVPFVDAVVAYDCPNTLETFLLVVRNGLYVHSMMSNLIPLFVMREAGFKLNGVTNIHIERQNLTNESHCIVSTTDGNGTKLRIPIQLDGIFSYFPTRNLTREEIYNCEYIKTVYLKPDAAEWDPYNEDYSERGDAFFYFRGYLIDHEPKQLKVLDDSDIYEIQVSQERYEFAIISIVAKNDTCVLTSNEDNNPCSNPQHDDMKFIRYDYSMQAGIPDLTACFNDEFLCTAVTEQA